ncbi:hypothetical protein ACP4OV_004781 [Aristida adscensionis]
MPPAWLINESSPSSVRVACLSKCKPTNQPLPNSSARLAQFARAPRMPSPRTPSPRAGGRWSDGETAALIDAWGPLNRRRHPRRLLLKEWRAVAGAVNAHRAAAGRPSNRDRAHCQNRVHTLKARYKEELARRAPSRWCHFRRLRAFLGSPAAAATPPSVEGKEMAKREEEEEEEEEVVTSGGVTGCRTVTTRPRNEAAGTRCCAAAVVMKLAEVYERVERLYAESEERQQAGDAVKAE